MAKPKTEAWDEKKYVQDVNFFYEVFDKLKDIEDFRLFLKDIFTPSEMRMVRRRWHVACLLDEGCNIREAAAEAGVSTLTAHRIRRVIYETGEGGFLKALEKTRSERQVEEGKSRSEESEEVEVEKVSGAGEVQADEVKKWSYGGRNE